MNTEVEKTKKCERNDPWWLSLSAEQKECFTRTAREIAIDFGEATKNELDAGSSRVQGIVRRQVAWLSQGGEISKEYLIEISELYVRDPEFRKYYDKYQVGTAGLICDAIKIYVERTYQEADNEG